MGVAPQGRISQQCYRAIGNSLNVVVVSVLMGYLFSDGSHSEDSMMAN